MFYLDLKNPFKVGDTVVCIDDTMGYVKCPFLKIGEKYLVKSVEGPYVNHHYHIRFKLVSEPKSLDDYM